MPSLFKNRSFGVGLGVNMVFEMAMISFFLTFTLLIQIGLGYSVIHAALTGLPVAFGIAFTMALAGEKVVPKLGRYALTLGTTIMAIGLILTLSITHHYQLGTHTWQLIPTLLLVGIGMGFVFGSLFAAVLNGVDARHAGSASGILNAVQQVGGAIGVAIIGVIFFGQLSHAAPASFDAVKPQLQQTLTAAHVPASAQPQIISGVEQCYVDQSRATDANQTPDSCKQLQQAGGSNKELSNDIKDAVRQANAANFENAFRWSITFAIALLVLTFGFSFLLPKQFKAAAYSEM
jgi:hypothetical protein